MPWSFFPACPIDDLPEDSKKRVEIGGYPVCLYNVGGTIYASGDLCPHEQVSLGEGGQLDGEIVTCGAHRWQFNVRTGECFDDPSRKLHTFQVGRKDGTIYVGFWED